MLGNGMVHLLRHFLVLETPLPKMLGRQLFGVMGWILTEVVKTKPYRVINKNRFKGSLRR